MYASLLRVQWLHKKFLLRNSMQGWVTPHPQLRSSPPLPLCVTTEIIKYNFILFYFIIYHFVPWAQPRGVLPKYLFNLKGMNWWIFLIFLLTLWVRSAFRTWSWQQQHPRIPLRHKDLSFFNSLFLLPDYTSFNIMSSPRIFFFFFGCSYNTWKFLGQG